MRAGDYQAALRRLPVGRLDWMSGGRGIVVVAPHPDDESLGCGGAIAQARLHGFDVRLVFVSDGGASHPNSPSYCRDRLTALRREEALKAAGILGVLPSGVTFLDLPDAAVPADGPEAEQAASTIAEVARRCGAGAMLVTSDLDPHCDHAAAASIARRACAEVDRCALYAYPIWVWTLDPEAQIDAVLPWGLRLDVRPYAAMKRQAIAAHASQLGGVITDDPTAFALDAATIDLCAGAFETYVEIV